MTNVSALTNEELLNEIKLRFASPAEGQASRRFCEEEIARLSAKLTSAEKAKSQFLSNVRNEVNNPLTSILGLASSIRGLTASEKVQRLSSMIYNQAFELDFQMRNIIVAAEIESGDITPLSTRVDVGGLLEDQIAYLKSKIDEKNVSVKMDVADAIKFRTDGYLLQTICLNIISNAIEYSSRNKFVCIAARESEGMLTIEVTDFGIGIQPDMQQVIFERFKQIDTGLTKSHPGHGLGLTISKELVELLGGQLNLQSPSGQGTTICIQLPAMTGETHCIGSSGFGNELLFSGGEEF
jgi:signal transduction histidine kinase